jgi:hypothetical protein
MYRILNSEVITEKLLMFVINQGNFGGIENSIGPSCQALNYLNYFAEQVKEHLKLKYPI